MTKTFVQLYVENLLKLLKVLKTRTALTMNGLSELRIRYARKSAKAHSKQRSKTSNKNEQTMKVKTKKRLTLR